MHDVNMCNKQYFYFFKKIHNCKNQLVQLWWINLYSHNINKSQSMIISMIGLVVVYDIIWLPNGIAYNEKM
jgi:hypothetical protein